MGHISDEHSLNNGFVQHLISLLIRANCKLYAYIVQSIYESYWHNLKQIATEFFSAGIHSGEVSLY